ncbi:tetratricopeptide repeat protein [Flavobacterium sp. xlx-214]|uniref:tetratricopeptide repeat protein n=1 Tax=unclassified Flavobacterium TaxID=196869 RepID=UPI0013D74374|nr:MULTISPECIES: tetratricopeptide repeat protein [unclassified Flavobacterium]MBA5792792.1 tetratricopeptide repeat protein [Flavobacterium sp. xlx-221]QMI83929.1 tetratricopeptide repeat protein [Flavobacterium sp. xlx-214]
MNKKITLSLALLSFVFSASAQNNYTVGRDIDTAMKYGQYDVAKKELYKLVKSQPTQGKNYYRLGLIHINEKNNDSANYYFKLGLKGHRDADINNLGLGKVLLLEGKDKEAKSKFNAATLTLSPGDFQTHLDIAQAYIHAPKPDYEAAYLATGAALIVNKDTPEPHLTRGDIYFAEKQFVDARRVYYEVSKMFPNSVLPKMKLADVFRAGNEFEDAIKMYNEVVALDSTYVDVYKQLGLTYADYARFKDDKTILQNGVSNYFKYHGLIGESMDSDNELAAYFIKNKDYKALSDLVRTKWFTRGDNFLMYRYRAIADFQNGQFLDAKESINKYFDVQDKKEQILPIDYLYKGLSELEASRNQDGTFNEGVYKKSIEEMSKAVKDNPKLGVALHDLGVDLFKDEHYEQAYFVFDLASKDEKSPYYVYDMYYKGNALYMASDKPMFNDQLQKAKENLDSSIKKTPTFEAYLISARINRNLNTPTSLANMEKDYEGFVDLLTQKGFANEPVFKDALIEAYTMIGNFNQTKNKAKATSNFQKVLQLDSSNEYARKQVQNAK